MLAQQAAEDTHKGCQQGKTQDENASWVVLVACAQPPVSISVATCLLAADS